MTTPQTPAEAASPRAKGKIAQDLAIIETILRNRYYFFTEIRDGIDIPAKLRALLISSITFFVIYGAVLGSTHSALQALSSAIKLPLLFLSTLVITTPTLYFFNVLFSSKQSLMQNVLLILTAITVTAVILLAFSPISLFFIFTTSQYQFFKLLNVVIFAIAGLAGTGFLRQGMKIVGSDAEGSGSRRRIVWLWIILYAFVGSQMAWTLRPFVGAPSMPFELFRQLGGNFYANIFASLGEVLGFFTVQ